MPGQTKGKEFIALSFAIQELLEFPDRRQHVTGILTFAHSKHRTIPFVLAL